LESKVEHHTINMLYGSGRSVSTYKTRKTYCIQNTADDELDINKHLNKHLCCFMQGDLPCFSARS
jgi:hypothetical protein